MRNLLAVCTLGKYGNCVYVWNVAYIAEVWKIYYETWQVYSDEVLYLCTVHAKTDSRRLFIKNGTEEI